jgi:hypothetical protein
MNKYIFCWNMKGYILLSGKIYQQSEITKLTLWIKSLNSDSQQFYKNEQNEQPSLTSNHWTHIYDISLQVNH